MQTSPELQIYTPDYGHSKSWVGTFKQMFSEIYNYRMLLWKYIRRDFVASYQHSWFGLVWKVVLPIIPLSVYIILQEVGILAGSSEMPRALFVVAGMTFWQLFSATLVATSDRLVSQASVITKIQVPLIIIYLSGLGQILFDFIVRLSLLVFLIVHYNIEPNWSWFILPFLCLPFIILGFALGIFSSFFAVYLSDVRNMISILVSYGAFASGAIFPLPKGLGVLSDILQLNGVYHLVQVTRDWLVTGHSSGAQAFAITTLVAICLLCLAIKKLYVIEKKLVSQL